MAWELEDNEPQESFGQSATRNVARQATNLGTRAIGLPGDILSAVNEYIAKPIHKGITGNEGASYEDTYLGQAIPTTQTHRKGIEEHTGDYLKPKNDSEKFVDNVVEDTALLFTPGGLATRGGQVLRGAQKIYRNLGKSLTANLVGEGVKDFASDEKHGDYAKMGSLFALSILDKPSAARRLGELYRNAEVAIPQGATQNATSLQTSLNRLTNRITRGRPRANLSASEGFVVDQAENVLGLVQNGQIPVDQAWAQLRTINDELTRILPELPWRQRSGIRSQAAQINHAINGTLREYGRTNRQFAQNFHPAQEAYSTIAQSHFVGNWVNRNIKNPLLNEGLAMLFGSQIGKAAASAAIPYSAAQLSYRVMRSPTLRQMYSDTLREAAKENVGSFNKHLQALDKQFSKETSKEKWELED